MSRITRSIITLPRLATRSALAAACVHRPQVFAAPAATALRTFGTSQRRLVESPLSLKLAEELSFELQSSSTESGAVEEPEFLKTFKEEGIWAIEDTAGQDEVALSRVYGNEAIKVTFSISDLDATPTVEEDPLNLSEREEGAPAEEEAVEEAVPEGFPVRASIVITKSGVNGALAIDATAQDGIFEIDNIAFYTSSALASALDAESDFERKGKYLGPAYENLDETLQDEWGAYLEERGIDSSLALFIPELAEWKEQNEYVKWLESVKSFVES